MECNHRIGPLTIGNQPRVVGTISTRDSLCVTPHAVERSCDIVEVRLDAIGSDTRGWMKNCQTIEECGFPVVLTLRLSREGGKWTKSDKDRERVLSSAIESLACVDVESTSVIRDSLCKQAANLKKSIIVSFHDFQRTPSLHELKKILADILSIPNAIPKISTMVVDDSDIETLMKLLELAKSRPVCIIGMGDKGTKTRTVFPSQGSCLTYGYLDSPSAPGQLSSSVLVQHMRQLLPDYNQDVIIRKEIMEYVWFGSPHF